ncbi:hypothetical protein CVT25_006672 [Psilocybe cyanescens]|uniref:CCHC-type domain-containing protein n=1 Tax=Psilocybe cyanescens TaxID=93625 RepID=A0A409XH53_PSICY|nr:hypothetical protein CVT25_006672 [Psilocybe cyanescens]
MDINNDIYNTDKKKITFILSFCMEGGAKLWKEQYLISRTRGTNPNQMIEWDTLSTFLKKFHDAFTPVDKTRSAMNNIKWLKQKTDERVEDIISKFKLLVGQANLGTETELDHTHLIGLFQKCITPRLADKIMFSEDLPRTIQGWYKKATVFDTNYRLAKTFREEPEEHRRIPQWNNFSRNNRNYNPNRMDVSTMTAEEQAKLIRKGTCFRCKQQGHLSGECPQKGPTNQNRTQGQPSKKWTPKELHTHIRNLNKDKKDELADLMVKMGFEEKEEKDF